MKRWPLGWTTWVGCCAISILLAPDAARAGVVTLNAWGQASQFRPVVGESWTGDPAVETPPEVRIWDQMNRASVVGVARPFFLTSLATSTDEGINVPQVGTKFVNAEIDFIDNAALHDLMGGAPDLALSLNLQVDLQARAPAPSGWWRQAVSDNSVNISASSLTWHGVSGEHRAVNGSFWHFHENSGIFDGLPEEGGIVPVSIPIVISPNAAGGLKARVTANTWNSAMSLDPYAFGMVNLRVADPHTAITLASNGQPVSSLGLEYTVNSSTEGFVVPDGPTLLESFLDFKRDHAGLLLAAYDVTTQFADLAEVAFLLMNPELLPATFAAFASKQTTEWALKSTWRYAIRQLLNDPPDPDYRQIALVQLPALPLDGLESLEQDLADLFRESVNLKRKFAAVLLAMLTSMERANAAAEAEDWGWVDIHSTVFEQYLSDLLELTRRIAEVDEALADYLSSYTFVVQADDLAAIQAYQASLLTDGLPEEVLTTLSLFGLTEEDVQVETEAFAAADASLLVGQTLSEMISDAPLFDAFEQVLLGEWEPQVIPEPSTLAVWSLLATLGISVGWWRRRGRPRRVA